MDRICRALSEGVAERRTILGAVLAEHDRALDLDYLAQPLRLRASRSQLCSACCLWMLWSIVAMAAQAVWWTDGPDGALEVPRGDFGLLALELKQVYRRRLIRGKQCVS